MYFQILVNLFEILQNEITASDVHNDEQQQNEDSSSDAPTHDFDLNLPTAHSVSLITINFIKLITRYLKNVYYSIVFRRRSPRIKRTYNT